KLFVADIPPSLGGDILKFTRDGVPSVFASEIGVPQENGGPEHLVIHPARQDVLQRSPPNERMSKWPITANNPPRTLHHSLKSPACSCVSITLPASSFLFSFCSAHHTCA